MFCSTTVFYFKQIILISAGKTCTNNENFNGTTFGTFRCPLPGMDQRQTYCCGSYNFQYCCRYWDDSGRQAGTIIGIIAVIVLILSISVFVSRVIQRRNYFKSKCFQCSTLLWVINLIFFFLKMKMITFIPTIQMLLEI